MTRLQQIAALRDNLQGALSDEERIALNSLRGAIGGTLRRGVGVVTHVCPRCGETVHGTRLMRKHKCTS